MKVLSIGRGEECNIILTDNLVSRRHAVLKLHATGKIEIVDMSQNGTFVNGVKLTPNIPYPITRKDVVSFAHVRQLDWTQVPDCTRYYKFALMGVGIIAAICLGLYLWSLIPDPTPLPPPNPVTPTVAEQPKEENTEQKSETSEEKNDSVKPSKNKKTDSSLDPSRFFPKKKKEVKKDSTQVEKKQDKQEKPEEQTDDIPVL